MTVDSDDDLGGIDPGEVEEAAAITSEMLWNIATGEEPCEDEALLREARTFAALKMRQDGYDYTDIASALSVARSTAWRYVSMGLKVRLQEKGDALRSLHLQRYEKMLQGVMERAQEGDTFSISAAMSIMNKIEALMGLEPPKKIEHSFGEQTDDARAALFKAIAALSGPGNPATGDPEPAQNGD